jgi:hypothetical protein
MYDAPWAPSSQPRERERSWAACSGWPLDDRDAENDRKASIGSLGTRERGPEPVGSLRALSGVGLCGVTRSSMCSRT